MTETLTARDFLQRAIKTMNDRGKRYDSPDGERSMGKAVDARHEAITRLAKVFDVLELARIVGHRDLRMLLVYYNPSAEDLSGKLK